MYLLTSVCSNVILYKLCDKRNCVHVRKKKYYFIIAATPATAVMSRGF